MVRASQANSQSIGHSVRTAEGRAIVTTRWLQKGWAANKTQQISFVSVPLADAYVFCRIWAQCHYTTWLRRVRLCGYRLELQAGASCVDDENVHGLFRFCQQVALHCEAIEAALSRGRHAKPIWQAR